MFADHRVRILTCIVDLQFTHERNKESCSVGNSFSVMFAFIGDVTNYKVPSR